MNTNPKALMYLMWFVIGVFLGTQMTVISLPDDRSYESVLAHCLETTNAITDTEVEMCDAIAEAAVRAYPN